MATLHFPSPSSGFIPSQDSETFRDTLDARIKLASSSNSKASSSSSSSSVSSSRRQSFAVASGEDKENSTRSGPLSRTASASSIKGKQAQSQHSQSQQRRRSSAAHPLTPSSSASRSRPNSVILNGSGSASASTSNSRSNSAVDINKSYNEAAEPLRVSASSRKNSLTARNSLDCTPALAGLALQDSALDIEEEEGSPMHVVSISPSSQNKANRQRSGSGDKARNGKRRSRKASDDSKAPSSTFLHNLESEDSDEGAGRPSSGSASIKSTNRRLSSSRSTSTLTPTKKRLSRLTNWDDGDAEDEHRPLGAEDDLEASLSALPTPLASPAVEAIPIVIRDYAFPSSDPRYKGELADPDPISIPAMPSYNNHYQRAWYDSPNPGGFSIANATELSTSVLSSSSSSSLSSSFTPPPFGSFGFGHAYHVDNNNGNQQSNGYTFSTSPQSVPPVANSKYSWNFVTDNNPRSAGAGSTAGSSTAAGDNDSAFTRSSVDTVMPNMLGSALSIEEFDEDFELDDDEEYEDHSGNQQSAVIPEGGLLYRAVYPFTAEAEQEMSLNEGDLVRVWEKLPDGWMVGGKTRLLGVGEEQETGESGLIPENYLVLAEDMLEQQDLPSSEVPASSSFATKDALENLEGQETMKAAS